MRISIFYYIDSVDIDRQLSWSCYWKISYRLWWLHSKLLFFFLTLTPMTKCHDYDSVLPGATIFTMLSFLLVHINTMFMCIISKYQEHFLWCCITSSVPKMYENNLLSCIMKSGKLDQLKFVKKLTKRRIQRTALSEMWCQQCVSISVEVNLQSILLTHF